VFFEFFAAIDAATCWNRPSVEIKRGWKRRNLPRMRTSAISRRMQLPSRRSLPVSVFAISAVFHKSDQIIAQDIAVAATTIRIARIHAALILIRGCVARIEASLILALTAGQIVDLSMLCNSKIAWRWRQIVAGSSAD